MRMGEVPLRHYRHHPRHWRENLYVYPVISRRSGGLSVGINLNPDTACNFDCVYCQVDRNGAPRVRDVDPARLDEELAEMVRLVESRELFADSAFADVPVGRRRWSDFAFSGDGEPTTCRNFQDCVQVTAERRRAAKLHETKLVLITDACYLTKPEVVAGLTILDANNGEIWAKLDAGTEAYYREVNRPNFPLVHVIEQITAAARDRAVVIQSLFMRLHGVPPPDTEIAAYCGRLNEIRSAGGRIDHVQVYTVARPPAMSFVTALSNAEVDDIGDRVLRETGLKSEVYYAA